MKLKLLLSTRVDLDHLITIAQALTLTSRRLAGVNASYLVNATAVPSRPVPFRSAWIDIVKRYAIPPVNKKQRWLRLKIVICCE